MKKIILAVLGVTIIAEAGANAWCQRTSASVPEGQAGLGGISSTITGTSRLVVGGMGGNCGGLPAMRSCTRDILICNCLNAVVTIGETGGEFTCIREVSGGGNNVHVWRASNAGNNHRCPSGHHRVRNATPHVTYASHNVRVYRSECRPNPAPGAGQPTVPPPTDPVLPPPSDPVLPPPSDPVLPPPSDPVAPPPGGGWTDASCHARGTRYARFTGGGTNQCTCGPNVATSNWSRSVGIRVYLVSGIGCRTREEICAMPVATRPTTVQKTFWSSAADPNGPRNVANFNCPGVSVPPVIPPVTPPVDIVVDPGTGAQDLVALAVACMEGGRGNWVGTNPVGQRCVCIPPNIQRPGYELCDAPTVQPPVVPQVTTGPTAEQMQAIRAARGMMMNLGAADEWRTADGTFNHLRLWTTVGVGAVVGVTAGALTNRAIRNHQLRSGYESIQCVAGHGTTAFFGEVFIVR